MKYSVKSILFLGVGGVSMHQLAINFKKMGLKVFGYDVAENKYTQLCRDNDIFVTNKFEKTICKVDLCVKTGAVRNEKYFNCLKKQNVPIIDRADALGWLCSKFKNVIAVAGTHGKSTTASLIYEILRNANKKVSCHIGADVKKARFNLSDDFLIVEACEYNKSFLKLKPTISVVTNIECEHMDSYKNLFNLRSAFLTFIKRAGKRFVYDEKSTKFLKKYGNIEFVEPTNLELQPKIKGEHNLKNISVAVAVCSALGVDEKIIKKTVNSFTGIPRRYELIGNVEDKKFFIDYAHHPTEVQEFIKTFMKEENNVQIIFQPHTYSRTKTFMSEFVETFKNVDNLIIYKEYPAREIKAQGKSAKDLYLEIKKINSTVKYCANEKTLMKNLNGENLAFVGAGNINLVAEDILKHITP